MSAYQLDLATLFKLVDAQRTERAMSWVDLSATVGVTPNVFVRMRQGSSNPDANTLVSLLMWLDWAPELALLVRPAGDVR